MVVAFMMVVRVSGMLCAREARKRAGRSRGRQCQTSKPHAGINQTKSKENPASQQQQRHCHHEQGQNTNQVCSDSSVGVSLVKEAEAVHVVVALLLGLRSGLVLLLLGAASGSSNWGSNHKRGRVGKESLGLLCEREGDLCGEGHGEDVLVAVGNHVWHRGRVGVVDGEGDGSNVHGAGEELANDNLVGDVHDSWVVGGAVVVHLGWEETVRERGDVEHVEEGGLGGADLLASLEEVDVVDNLNGTTADLGLDVEGLEEGGLLGIEGGGANTGRGGNLVVEKHVAHAVELALGEDEANVANNVGQQLGKVCVLSLQNGAAHHGVLAKEDLALATEGNTDLLQLVGADIVAVNDEDAGVLLKEGLELGEVVLLPGGTIDLDHFECMIRFRNKSSGT